MATILLITIYFIFIGLGIPDSVFGSAWPAIYPDLNLPVGSASVITVILSLCTTLASFFSAKLINKFGTRTIAIVSTALTAISLLGFSLSNSMWALCLCAVPSGFGAGAIDAALNNYVAVNYKPSQLNFLHCFYGVGVAVSPLLLSITLSNGDWRLGYRIVFYIQLAITFIAILSFPLWKKVKGGVVAEQDYTPKTLTYRQMFKMPAVRVGWIVFFTTCALEFTCDYWCCTYLVSAEGTSESDAALYLMVYYVGMALGRFLSGLISSKMSEKKILSICYPLIGIAIVTLFLPVPIIVKGCALFLIGFGNGPTYPNLTLLTTKTFGKEISQSLVSSQSFVACIGILIIPPIFGILAQYLSLKAFPYFMGGLFVIMAVFTVTYFRRIKALNKDNLIFDKE